MATLDIFSQDAFSTISLTDAINKQDFQPSFLRNLGLFMPRRVRTETIAIEERDGVLNLIPTSERGAPLDQRETQKRKVRNFNSVRIAKGDRILASEIQNIRAFGSESELMQVQAEVASRMNGPSGLMREVEMTWENLMLGAVQGIVADADGSTLFNWFTEFGVNQATEIDFDLDNTSADPGAVRKNCSKVRRQMQRNAKGAWVPGRTMIMGLCGDNFYDDLTANSEVRETYLNTQQASDLRNDVGIPFESFRYGGITFVNYQGTDDESTVSIDTDKCKFFPIGAPGAFQIGYSPGEFLSVVNTPGRDVYAITVPDEKRNMFVDIEVYSYPLPICTRPAMLQRAKRT